MSSQGLPTQGLKAIFSLLRVALIVAIIRVFLFAVLNRRDSMACFLTPRSSQFIRVHASNLNRPDDIVQ